MKINDELLEALGKKFVANEIRETEGITFEQFIKEEIRGERA